MKKLYLTLLFSFLMYAFANAQSGRKISFQYDNAGNQIVRFLCVNCYNRKSETNPKKEEIKEEIAEGKLQKFFPEDVISYYPNPVKEELYLKWELVNDNKVKSIDIFNVSGQLIKHYGNKEKDVSHTIMFQDYPIGFYYVNLIYTSGEMKSIKIIKE